LSGRTNVTVRNTQIKNFTDGIKLYSSSNNIISGNNITNNSQGIHLWRSSGNSISGNNINNNGNGIILNDSSSNSISGNNITNNNGGIWLMGSSDYNSVSRNTIADNNVGLSLAGCSSSTNTIHHNNFIDNDPQSVPYNYVNAWDDGYPSGGNYWSDYTGVDEKSGPDQDLLGSDGIGDTPYILDTNNKDRYPLMNTWVLDTTKPTANAGQDQIVNVGATVTFDGGDSTDNVGIVSYEWNFGDGTTGTGKTTTHVYTSPGTYTVTLAVNDVAGNTATNSITVTVHSSETPPPPAEAFPMWIVGAAVALITIAVVATFLWRRKK